MRRGRTERAPAATAAKTSLAVPFAAAVLTTVTAAAYHDSFGGPLVFDDVGTILDNPSIRSLWPLTAPLSPPTNRGITVAGRPLLNLSFALNYALSYDSVWSYHLVNLCIHVAAALTLFGVLRRTFLLPSLRPRFGAQATLVAAAAALVWAVHPLQTAAVTYLSQRAESLCGLFYLLTLYAFLRSLGGAWVRAWRIASVLACLAAVATKEVGATAPLIVLLFDAILVAGSLRRSLLTRRGYYAGLSSAWLLLAWLFTGADSRGGTVGFGATAAPWWSYPLTQVDAIARYLLLSLWPAGQVFDYGNGLLLEPSEVWLELAILLVLGAAVLWALRSRPAAGFLGLWFLLILAPTSSVFPVATQTIAEHRMYLPLAALAVGAVLLAQRWLPYWWLAVGAAIVALAVATASRNQTYRTSIALWSDTATKAPANPRASNNLGLALVDAGRPADAIDPLAAAVRLEPESVEYNTNVAGALTDLGWHQEALVLIEEVTRGEPRFAPAYEAKARLFVRLGRTTEAADLYRRALRLAPDYADAHRGLADLLAAEGRWSEASEHYGALLRARPGDEEARRRLSALETRSRQTSEARGAD